MSNPSLDIITRKHEHISLALDARLQGIQSAFTSWDLPYSACPDVNLAEIDTAVPLFTKKLQQPLIIASMTGGMQHGEQINANLARAAQATGVALGVGSQRVTLEQAESKKSFAIVRELAPDAVIFANMGAIQLNYGYTVDDYRKVVEMIGADALYLHMNPLQEAIQPGGDTNFAGLREKIIALIEQIEVPVFIKEVGHGLDPQTSKIFIEAGAAGIDLAGTGGTSWAGIEAARAGNQDFGDWFSHLGYPTDWLVEHIAPMKQTAKVVASGGMRSPIQGLKALMLGADFYSAARPFLEPALESTEAVIAKIEQWQKGLEIALFSINAGTIDEAKGKKLIRL